MMNETDMIFDDLVIGIPTSDNDVIIDIDDYNDWDKVIRIDNDNDNDEYNNDNDNDEDEYNIDNEGSKEDQYHYEKIFDTNLDIFPILKNGIGFPIFMFNILPYLSTIDLFNILSISRHLRQVDYSALTWKHYTDRDFSCNLLQHIYPNIESENNNNSTEISLSYSDYRSNYIKRFYEMKERIDMSKINKKLENKLYHIQSRARRIEFLLDLTQVRFLIPLILSSVFSSTILFALYFDGNDINVWICMSPILFSFLYLHFCIFIARLVYIKKPDENSILYNMWDKLNGPIKFFLFTEESAGFTYLVCSYIMLFFLQVILLTFKFDENSVVASTLNWGTIFLPIWIAYVMYITLPLYLTFNRDGIGSWIGGIILLWIPTIVFMICLVIKLSNAETNNLKLSLKLIFFPFWLIEGIFMSSTLTFLVIGCIGQDNLHENTETFLSTWLTLSPFVIFQALLSARDDNRESVKTIDALVPLLICVAWLFLVSLVSVCNFRSSYDETRMRKRQEESGKKIVWTL